MERLKSNDYLRDFNKFRKSQTDIQAMQEQPIREKAAQKHQHWHQTMAKRLNVSILFESKMV